MDILKLSKEAYRDELARHDELRKASGLPMGIASLLAGALFTIFRIFNWGTTLVILPAVFWVAWAVGTATLSVAIYNLIKAYVGYEYAYAPTVKDILSFRTKLAQYYDQPGSEGYDIDTEVDAFLLDEFSNNAHHNAFNNDSKSGLLHRASVFLVATLVCTAIAGSLLLIEEYLR